MRPGPAEDEPAYYDALEIDVSTVKVLSGKTLAKHRPQVGRDGAQKHNYKHDLIRKRSDALRALGKHIVRTFDDPLDKQEKATQTVVEQAKAPSAAWTVAERGI